MCICYKVQKKQIYSSVAWATPCITSQHELLMVLSSILVSKETDFFYTMAHVKATEAFLGLVLKQRKVTYSNAGRKMRSTELTDKPKLWMINDIKVNFNYLIFASHMWTLTTQIRNCLYQSANFIFHIFKQLLTSDSSLYSILSLMPCFYTGRTLSLPVRLSLKLHFSNLHAHLGPWTEYLHYLWNDK